MNPAPRDTIHQRPRPWRTALPPLCWGLCHPLRLLRRYGFGWFQFAVLIMPVLLVMGLVVGLDPLLRP
jgi:hypothetical protein